MSFCLFFIPKKLFKNTLCDLTILYCSYAVNLKTGGSCLSGMNEDSCRYLHLILTV